VKTLLKWLSIIIGIVVAGIAAAVIILPQFVDVEKYKPVIEQKVTEATGRSFTLGDEIDLSVFPWLGVKLTDLHFGSGEGFKQKDMVSVKNFEVRLKVMPLLSRKIEVKTFVLDTPTIYLEKLKSGDANWHGIGKKEVQGEKSREKSAKKDALPIQALLVGNFSIINGKLVYTDQGSHISKEISDLNLNLSNISFENPIGISFNAKLDGRPVSLEGTAGPVGKNPGKGTIPLDFVLKALGELDVKVAGSLIDPAVKPSFDLEFNIAPFSPRKLCAAVNMEFPVTTGDQEALGTISLKSRVKGSPGSVELSGGLLGIDDSKLKFSAAARNFTRPDLKFALDLDHMDLDRYLPPIKSEDSSTGQKETASSGKKKIDYDPLRKLILDGKIKAGKLKIRGASLEDVVVHILAKNGIITIDPLDLNLYQGKIASKLELNVQKKQPAAKIAIDAEGIEAGPLLKDVLDKELIEGKLKADVGVSVRGDSAAVIKQTLAGKGELLFTDGAVIGIDLANMVRNIKSKLGMGEKLEKKPRTDFAELKIPFMVKNGTVNTGGSSLKSPLIRVLVTGKTDLVKELLDFRVEPKFVATLKGQGDTDQRSGLMVPVVITGTFTSPKIRPDLKGLIKGDLKNVEGLLKGVDTKAVEKIKIDAVEKDVKKKLENVLPGLLK